MDFEVKNVGSEEMDKFDETRLKKLAALKMSDFYSAWIYLQKQCSEILLRKMFHLGCFEAESAKLLVLFIDSSYQPQKRFIVKTLKLLTKATKFVFKKIFRKCEFQFKIKTEKELSKEIKEILKKSELSKEQSESPIQWLKHLNILLTNLFTFGEKSIHFIEKESIFKHEELIFDLIKFASEFISQLENIFTTEEHLITLQLFIQKSFICFFYALSYSEMVIEKHNEQEAEEKTK